MSRLLYTALVAAIALPVQAQDAGTGLTFGGEVKLEYLDSSSHDLALDGDLGLSWRSGGLLGFDAALDGTYLDDGTDLTNLWAALVLSTGAGEFALGAPRPLVETLGVMPRFSSSRLLDLESTGIRGPFTPLASASDNGVTPGVTWTGSGGSLSYGLGYHHLNDGANVNVVEGVMRYESGPMALFVSGEYADRDGANLTILQIGGLHDADRFDLGAAFAQTSEGDTTRSLRLYGSIDAMASLTLRGDALLVQDGSDSYSLSATYTMPNGLFVEGGGTKVTGSSQDIIDIGVGYKF